LISGDSALSYGGEMQWTLEHKACPIMPDVLCYSNDCWEDSESHERSAKQNNEMFTEDCLRYIRLRMQKEILFGDE